MTLTVPTVPALRTSGVRDGIVSSFLRTPLLLAGTAVAAAILTLAGWNWQAVGQVSVATFTAVNLLCWWILARRLRAEGRGFGDLLGRWRPADLAWGLLWAVVLFVPFSVGLTLVATATAGGFGRIGEVFTPPVVLPGGPWMWAVAAVGLVFPFVNAPIEELYYRGYAQGAFAASGRRAWAVWVPSVGFAIQHLFVAQSLAGIPAYLAAFFLWGLTAALIRRRHPRTLWPLVIAHVVTNLSFSVVPMVLLVTGQAA